MDCGFENGDRWFRYRAAAIIIEDGSVLFAKNELDSYYYSIGGGVHLGEKAEDAVKREVFEETGISYEINRLAFIHENFFEGSGTFDGLKCHEITFYFLMKSRGTKELNSNSYTQGVREYMHWLPINKLKEYVAYPSFFADKLLSMKNNVEHIVSCD
ncbi:NUDIX hydrolase [Clostridium sp.]|uniref:NUDIX hydrolase n=1 Tax=Clostridium sp. TaxID=1506 RepID=UPI003D6D6988